MKWNMFVGALVVSVGLCSQSFGFELLDRMLGIRNGCCERKCCDVEPACCEPACCEQTCCEPEPTCCDPCNKCCRKRIDLFAGLRGLFDGGCCKPKCCEPACCEPEPTCCEAPSCCDPCNKCCRGGLLKKLFRTRKCCNSGCNSGCSSCAGGNCQAAEGEAAPAPPMADPSASNGKERIINASRSIALHN